MPFEWSAPVARFEVFDVECEVEIGDAKLSDEVQRIANKIRSIDFEKLNGDSKMYTALSAELRGIVRAIVGEDAAKKIFAGRNPNVVMEINMLAYIYEQLDAAKGSGPSIDGAMARIAALARPIGDEE